MRKCILARDRQGSRVMRWLIACLLLTIALSPARTAAQTPPPFVLTWGTNGSGPGQFSGAGSIALGPTGNLYVADGFNNRIQVFDADGNYLMQWGSAGTGNGQFNYPGGIAVDAQGIVYVCENGDRVQTFTSNGTFITKWGSTGTNDGQFKLPRGIAVDANSNVFVIEQTNQRVQKFTSAGVFVAKWGTFGSGNGQFNNPWGIAVDGSGNVYVPETNNNRVQKFTNSGAFILKWGSSGSGDGQFSNPRGIEVDAGGNVYVTEYLNNRIQQFTDTGVFVTKWGTNGSANGQFVNPTDAAASGSGVVYVADTGNRRIQKFGMAAVPDSVFYGVRMEAGGPVAFIGISPLADCDSCQAENLISVPFDLLTETANDSLLRFCGFTAAEMASLPQSFDVSAYVDLLQSMSAGVAAHLAQTGFPGFSGTAGQIDILSELSYHLLFLRYKSGVIDSASVVARPPEVAASSCTNWIAPDFDFEACCAAHDACYDACSVPGPYSGRLYCDEVVLDCWLATWTPDEPRSDNWARFYYGVIRVCGDSHYCTVPPGIAAVTSVSLNEGNAGVTPNTFLVTLTNRYREASLVAFRTGDGTATANGDYQQQASGTLTIDPFTTSGNITVNVNGDTAPELDETFLLEVGVRVFGTFLVAGTGIGTIINDDTPPAPVYPPVPEIGESFYRTIEVSVFEEVVNPVGGDTVRYGATEWNAANQRWQAIRGGTWTFDSGVGSSMNTGGNPNKPVGYHATMEGWSGRDETLPTSTQYFRRSTVCTVDGSPCMWAGVNAAEAQSLCYAKGLGYGNNWHSVISKSFNYPGAGARTLEFDYRVESQAGDDYLYVMVDTTGDGTQDDLMVAAYSGTHTGAASWSLAPGDLMRSSPGPFVVKFVAFSDAAYSDEDGLHDTDCGLGSVDNVVVSGDVSDFNGGSDGWAQESPEQTGVGDYTNIEALENLPVPATFCECGVADSVLVFLDQFGGHPLDQDNMAISPWIDLMAGGDAGRPGKVILYDVYAELPLTNYIALQFQARWYPAVSSCTGLMEVSDFHGSGRAKCFGETPFCSGSGSSMSEDITGIIPAQAEEIQIGIEVINLCRISPLDINCSGVTNESPYIDNVSLGVFGSGTRPLVTMSSLDDLQDSFATDGTLNPAAPGRLDINRLRPGGRRGPGSSLGDSLVAWGDGGNTEVRLVFKVRSGPFTSAAALGAWSAQWTPEPGVGAGWYSARMDTAEVGGVPFQGRWMSTFHESDPGFSGTDRTADPYDPMELENEIFPDHILTPGSRVDYFLKARYLPPDPRSLGGNNWTFFPDPSGSRPILEAEILPSSMSADSTWNCTLYVDHHDDRDFYQQIIEEQGLTASLGVGSSNAEGTRYDRFDVRSSSAGQLSFGRPIQTNFGASTIQIFGYSGIVWHGGDLSSLALTNVDAYMIGPWLTLPGIGSHRFWASGSNLAQSMRTAGGTAALGLMENVFGVRFNCNSIRLPGCPAGAALDSTFCVPTGPVGGSDFQSSTALSLRGNGCPDVISFDLLRLNQSVSSAKGQLNYVKGGVSQEFASISNHNTIDVDYMTVLDGFPLGRVRTAPSDPHNPGQCTNTGAAVARTDDILDWFGSPITCMSPAGLVDVPMGGPMSAQPPRSALGNAYPNPMNPTTRIGFVNGTENGRVSLRIFDVTGRLVKSLVEESLPAGAFEVTWDGNMDDGSPVPSGMYFYRMISDQGRFVTSKKFVVMK